VKRLSGFLIGAATGLLLLALIAWTTAVLRAQGPVDLKKTNWTLTGWKGWNWSSSMPMSNDRTGALVIPLPDATKWFDTGKPNFYVSINYLYARGGRLAANNIVVANVEYRITSGAPIVQFNLSGDNNGTVPGNFRLYMASSFLDWNDEFGRWWANPAVPWENNGGMFALAPGQATISMSLDPANWTSVYGKRGSDFPDQFAAFLSRDIDVGGTFGGGDFFGHGVATTNGTAEVRILRYEVQ